MPDLYGEDGFDVAGFSVGVAERRRLVGGARVEAGDAVVGLASTGVHANGFTLVRRLLERAEIDPADAPEGLLAPTAIYANAVRELMVRVDVRAMAHITGGGLPGNLPRVLPKGLGARLELAAWPRPEVFGWLAGLGVEEDEMRRVFNLGLGYLVVVPAGEADEAIRIAVAAGHPAYRAGEIVPGAGVELV
jgi:phosphoribosylformylglycinamidine cyclo-ligase